MTRLKSITKNVRRIIIHEDYNSATFENDVALLEVDGPVKFNAHIIPICLPQDDNSDYANRMATVTGWGRLKDGTNS